MLGLVALLASAAVPVHEQPSPEVEIEVRDGLLRLGDLSSFAAIPPAGPSEASTVLARLPRGATRARLSRQALAGLVRRALPATRFALAADVAGVTLISEGTLPARSDEGCLTLALPVVAGTALAERHVATSACGLPPSGALRFDRRDGLVRAAKDLPVGMPLGHIAVASDDLVERGTEMTLSARAGPVVVARRVTALQAAHPGQRLFVAGADGTIVSAPLSADLPQ